MGDLLLRSIDILAGYLGSLSVPAPGQVANNASLNFRFVAFHGRIGTIRQLVHDELTASSAIGKFESLHHAQDELNRAKDDLVYLHQNAIIDSLHFTTLSNMIHDVEGQLSDLIDPEYMS